MDDQVRAAQFLISTMRNTKANCLTQGTTILKRIYKKNKTFVNNITHSSNASLKATANKSLNARKPRIQRTNSTVSAEAKAH